VEERLGFESHLYSDGFTGKVGWGTVGKWET
jgi:hypothetical protein